MSYPRLLALVIPVVLIAVALRLTGITAIGVGGSDTILYYTLAESWNRGEFTYQIGDSTAIFRPVLLAFNGWSLSLFGHTDAAIKLANVSVDALNILLVAALAWTISRRTAVVLASVVTYAFLPIAIWSARQELPHTLSTLFALLCALPVATAIVTDTPRRRTALMALAGLALLGAVLVHEELVLLALPYLLVFLLSRPGAEAAGPVDKLGGGACLLLLPGRGRVVGAVERANRRGRHAGWGERVWLGSAGRLSGARAPLPVEWNRGSEFVHFCPCQPGGGVDGALPGAAQTTG